MKEFILLVRVPLTYSSEQAKEVNPKWEAVINKWKAGNVFVTSFAFPGNSFVLSGEDRAVNNNPVISDNLRLVSSIIVTAADSNIAINLAKLCPVLDYAGNIEIREIQQRRVNTSNGGI